MRTFEEVQDELRECIGHAYRDDAEDIQKFGGQYRAFRQSNTSA